MSIHCSKYTSKPANRLAGLAVFCIPYLFFWLIRLRQLADGGLTAET